VRDEIKRDFGFDVDFEKAKHMLEENDGAGNVQGDSEARAHRYGCRGRRP
jgi:hypothetical protein